MDTEDDDGGGRIKSTSQLIISESSDVLIISETSDARVSEFDQNSSFRSEMDVDGVLGVKEGSFGVSGDQSSGVLGLKEGSLSAIDIAGVLGKKDCSFGLSEREGVSEREECRDQSSGVLGLKQGSLISAIDVAGVLGEKDRSFGLSEREGVSEREESRDQSSGVLGLKQGSLSAIDIAGVLGDKDCSFGFSEREGVSEREECRDQSSGVLGLKQGSLISAIDVAGVLGEKDRSFAEISTGPDQTSRSDIEKPIDDALVREGGLDMQDQEIAGSNDVPNQQSERIPTAEEPFNELQDDFVQGEEPLANESIPAVEEPFNQQQDDFFEGEEPAFDDFFEPQEVIEVPQSALLDRVDFLSKRLGVKFDPDDLEIRRYLVHWKTNQEFTEDWVPLAQINLYSSEFPWDICRKSLYGNSNKWYFLTKLKLKVGGVSRTFAGGAGHWDQIGSRKITSAGLFKRRYRFSSELGINDNGYIWTLDEYQLSKEHPEALCRVERTKIPNSTKRKSNADGTPKPKKKKVKVNIVAPSQGVADGDAGSGANQISQGVADDDAVSGANQIEVDHVGFGSEAEAESEADHHA